MPRALGARAPHTIQELPRDFRAGESGTVMQMVKAVNGAIVYGTGDVPISEEEFQAVELTPTISEAIKAGDLVKDGRPFMDADPDERLRALATPRRRAVEVKTTEANPVPPLVTSATAAPPPRPTPPPRPQPRRPTPPAE